VVFRCWVVGGNKGGESDELVGDDLDTDQTTDEEKILALARYTEQKSDRVEDVSEDEFQGEIVLAVQVDVAAPPGEQTVDHVQQRNNAQQRRDDHTGNLETEPCTVGESVQSVCSLVLLIVWDDNATSSKSLFLLGVTKLGESERGRNTHDTR
jgi:hypothetical protein